MLANARFLELLSDIQPSATTQTNVSAAHTSARNHLWTHETFKKRLVHDFLAGSNARDTALRPKTTPDGVERPDVDICVETSFKTSDAPITVLHELRDALKDGGFFIERVNNRSVRISTSYAEIDIVPLVASGSMYELPDRESGSWKLTNPPRHNSWSVEQNAAFDGRFKPVVKLFKTFRRENETGKRPKGFVLEVLTSMYAPKNVTHYGEMFTQLLEGIYRAYWYTVPLEIVPSISDPALSSNNILSKVSKTDWITFMERVRVHAGYARRAQDATDVDEATRLWRKVLGERFPSSPISKSATSYASAPARDYVFPDVPVAPTKPLGFA